MASNNVLVRYEVGTHRSSSVSFSVVFVSKIWHTTFAYLFGRPTGAIYQYETCALFALS